MIPSKLSRLANIKGIYQAALQQLENPTPLEGAIGLVLFDNALEAAFKLVLDESEAKRKERNFPDLLSQALCVDEIKDLAQIKRDIQTLRDARNGFQHQGIIPDLSTIQNEYKPLSEHVLKIISKKKFGLEWDGISLSQLIKTEHIRALMMESEAAFAQKDYATAAAYLICSFELVKYLAQITIFGSGLSSKRNTLNNTYNKELPWMKYITTLDEEIEIFKLGLDYGCFRNYIDVASSAGVNSILYEFPTDTEVDALIAQYKNGLSSLTNTALIACLRDWCIDIHDFVLKFAIRTEANPRYAFKIIGKFVNSFFSWLKTGKKATESEKDSELIQLTHLDQAEDHATEVVK
jgi:hypothetical protein